MVASPLTRTPERRALAAALLVAAVLVILGWRTEFQLARAWGYSLDDTWIHCTIARNLVQGHGWSYNPGDGVQNSSGPLWTLLIAGGYLVGGTSVWVPKILAALTFLGCVWMASRLVRTLGGDGWAQGAAALATALSGSLLWHALSGMETVLAAFLVAWTLDAFLAWRTGRRRFVWPALAALGTMTRPEVLMLVPLLAGLRLFEERRLPNAWRRAAIAGGVALAVLIPYFVLNLRGAGSLFPSTFAAKSGATGLLSGLRHGSLQEILVSLTLAPYVWLVHALAFLGRTNIVLLLCALLGVVAAARGDRRSLAPALVLVLFPLLRGAAAPHMTPVIQQGRYIAAILPLYFAVAAIGLVAFVRGVDVRWDRRVLVVLAGCFGLALLFHELRVPRVGPGPWSTLVALLPGVFPPPGLHMYMQWQRLGLLVGMIVLLVLLALTWARGRSQRGAGIAIAALALALQVIGLVPVPRFHARNVRNIQDMDVTLGRWVRERVPPGRQVAVNDIGALAFFGERPVVDAMGLATPELAPYLSPRRLRTLIGMRTLRPEICVLFPTWFPEWTAMPSLLVPLMRHTVTDNTILGYGTSVIYRADWERFGRYYSDALLERLDPPVQGGTFAAYWRLTLFNLGMPTRAQLFRHAGDLWDKAGNAAAAERAYRKSVTLEPQKEDAWTALLQLYGRQRDAARYEATLDEMVRALPNSPAAFEALGDYRAAAGRAAEAAAHYEQALALRPDSVRLLGKLEAYWARQGDGARAASYRSRLAELQTSAGAP